MQKLYFYVDETGQDTKGRFFLVAIAIVSNEQDKLRELLSKIEKSSGKLKRSWTESTWKQKKAYINGISNSGYFKDNLFFSQFADTTDYLNATIVAVAKVILQVAPDEYKVRVAIHRLNKMQIPIVRKGLSRQGVETKDVKGPKARNEAFIRLADAFAGFIRDYLEGQKKAAELFHKIQQRGMKITEL